jgi:hypothetical protein
LLDKVAGEARNSEMVIDNKKACRRLTTIRERLVKTNVRIKEKSDIPRFKPSKLGPKISIPTAPGNRFSNPVGDEKSL